MRAPSIPAFRCRTINGKRYGYVCLVDASTRRRKDKCLGDYDDPKTRECYHRTVADWEANGRRLVDEPVAIPPDSITISELCLAYLKEALNLYGPGEIGNIKLAIRVLVRTCGSEPAIEFGPNKLRQVRQVMIQGDPHAQPRPRQAWSRSYINKQVSRIQRVFR